MPCGSGAGRKAMKLLLLTSIAILGLSGTAFAGMIDAPGTWRDPNPSIWQHTTRTQKMPDYDIDRVVTGSIAARNAYDFHGMYETPRSNLRR